MTMTEKENESISAMNTGCIPKVALVPVKTGEISTSESCLETANKSNEEKLCITMAKSAWDENFQCNPRCVCNLGGGRKTLNFIRQHCCHSRLSLPLNALNQLQCTVL